MPKLGHAAGYAVALAAAALTAQSPRQVSGIYPHLAMFNDEGECGTGAVVPWAGRLWVITYAPHAPRGSSDKLYEITPALEQIVRPESVGGTPANRMIHRESNQLFLGPYVLDGEGEVRVIPYATMFGRPTANARHLFDPAGKVYCATMEEGLYEIDVRTLAVTELWADEQQQEGRHADLPGYHGKGLYSGQGRLVYANNGEHGERARRDPTTESGALAEWDGKADAWTVVRRAQFTEVTGPGGILGNENAADDPVWAIGWDHRSLILMVRDGGRWHPFRLPKGSHSYDGAHGWNTEWPRIRDIGEDDLLMTMHGLFWRFPRAFRPGHAGGLAPRSAYLKVIGDFCRWQDRVVFGCDDTAKSEFLNKRRAKGAIAAPRSQSNLWFVEPSRLDRLGPVRAVGGPWVHEDVPAGAVTEPFLLPRGLAGGLHLAHAGMKAVTVVLEVDVTGSGDWRRLQEVELEAAGHAWVALDVDAGWLRLRAPGPLTGAVAYGHWCRTGGQVDDSDPIFAGLAGAVATRATGGLVRARGGKETTLALAATRSDGGAVEDVGCYELDGDLQLRPTADAGLHAHTLRHAAIPAGVLDADAASLLYVDDAGRRWRLPRGSLRLATDSVLGPTRVAREVATERDLFHAGGTFFELPAENAGGFRKVRPIATHGLLVHDYCSYRGLLVMTGVRPDAEAGERVVRSADGRAAVWVGAVDDLWRLGRPRGRGGPWLETPVAKNAPSDPYLVTGYDHKTLALSHDADAAVTFTLEADLCGDGEWTVVETFVVPAGATVPHTFPGGWSCYWLRLRCDRACTATAQLDYR